MFICLCEHSYFISEKLNVNMKKTQIIFSRGKIENNVNFKLGFQNVKVVSDYIYLGVTFNYNGNFSKAIKKQLNSARKAMFSLVTKARRLFLPNDIVIDLFVKTVLPILLYGSEI